MGYKINHIALAIDLSWVPAIDPFFDQPVTDCETMDHPDEDAEPREEGTMLRRCQGRCKASSLTSLHHGFLLCELCILVGGPGPLCCTVSPGKMPKVFLPDYGLDYF